METLGAFLDSVCARQPEAEAVAHAPQAEVTARMAWAELCAASRVAAKKLVALGVGKGTRVGFLCSNRIEWLPIAFGALRIGAILVPFSTLWKRDEIAYGLTHGDAEILLTLPGFLKHDYLASLHDIVPDVGHFNVLETRPYRIHQRLAVYRARRDRPAFQCARRYGKEMLCQQGGAGCARSVFRYRTLSASYQ